jgi:hypothetical protein
MGAVLCDHMTIYSMSAAVCLDARMMLCMDIDMMNAMIPVVKKKKNLRVHLYKHIFSWLLLVILVCISFFSFAGRFPLITQTCLTGFAISLLEFTIFTPWFESLFSLLTGIYNNLHH